MSSPRRFRSGPYAVHHLHLTGLITQARPLADGSYLADAFLASLAAALYTQQRHHDKMSRDRIKAGLDDLVHGLRTNDTKASRNSENASDAMARLTCTWTAAQIAAT